MAGEILDSIAVFNFILSLVVYLLVNLASGAFVNEKDYGWLTAFGRWIFHSRGRAMCVNEVGYLYVLLCLIFLTVPNNPSVLQLVLLIGLGGAIAVPTEIYLLGKGRYALLSRPNQFVFNVEHDYKTKNKDDALSTVRDMIDKSKSDEQAQTALVYFLDRRSTLGDFVRGIVAEDEFDSSLQ
jgi:hypothetical protein